jgi:eukaryotic-like serine/threonine-protein kinase
LTLGEFSKSQLPGTQRARLFETIKDIYKFDPDAGLHAAAEWLLKQWNEGQSIQTMKDQLSVNEQQLRSQMLKDDRHWYINKQGQTFVILNADEFQMGSPLSESERRSNEARHRRQIGRKIAIASKELTKGEYRRFLEANSNAGRIDIDQSSKTNDLARVNLNWYDAARYCNWLSQIEGLPEDQWCYVRNVAGEYAEGMRAAPDFLERTGYRLPTEAEWEFACRAGAHTSRYYGESDDLLIKYALFARNSPKQFAQPTGLLKPNDFGLFDMLGNVSEWCHDAFGEYPINATGEATSDVGDAKAVQKNIHRVLRGGSFVYGASIVRSAYRFDYQPEMDDTDFGFRPARTYPSAR